MPFFAHGTKGDVYLSWIDPEGSQAHALRLAKWSGAGWAQVETIAQGKNWFVNWADFPSLSVTADASMLAHWLARPESGGKYGYGIRVAHRAPGPTGRWSPVAAINENDPEDYAGFLSFAGTRAAYLAPLERNAAVPGQAHTGSGHGKSLRLAEFNAAGELSADRLLDADVCSCCQTTAVETSSGLLIAYRDHLPGEIRDISLVRIQDGRASAPEPLHRDGWRLNGCPTEGPSGASAGSSVGIAWITRAQGTSRLQLAWSQDGGAKFRPPVAADDGQPLGRPQLVALDASQFLLVWLERTAAGADIRLRRVGTDGRIGPSVVIASVAGSRSTGLPRIAVFRDQVLVAWRENAVRAGWRPLSSLPELPKQAN